MIITSKPGRGNKIHVMVDDEYLTTVDDEFWYAEGFVSGAEVDGQTVAAFQERATYRRAYNQALWILSHSPKTRKALIQKMIRSEVDPDIAEQVADQLVELRVIDDRAYAEKWAEEVSRQRKYAPDQIVRGLISKGIERELAQDVVEELEIDEKPQLKSMIRQKYHKNLSDPMGIRRTCTAMMRKGYQYSDIRRAIDEILEEDADGFDDDEG